MIGLPSASCAVESTIAKSVSWLASPAAPVAGASRKPTVTMRSQPWVTMLLMFGAKSESLEDSASAFSIPRFFSAASRPSWLDSLKDLSSQPPASETMQAL